MNKIKQLFSIVIIAFMIAVMFFLYQVIIDNSETCQDKIIKVHVENLRNPPNTVIVMEFIMHVTTFTITCTKKQRFGQEGDGGYWICMDPAYVPLKNSCLVYSFGIRNEWSFDDAMHDDLGCEVHSFDPSMEQDDHKRKERLFFHNLGIWHNSTTNNLGWKLLGLKDIIQMLGHEKRTIDYLKIDVEGAEWPAFQEMLKTNSLNNVKQMIFEIHTPKLKDNEMNVEDFVQITKQLTDLQLILGFNLWSEFHINGCCGRFSTLTPSLMAKKPVDICCYELFYLNTKLNNI